MQWKSVEDVLQYAIDREQAAHDFYRELAERVPQRADMFISFAKEELGHKAKLTAMKAGKKLIPAERKVLDLKMADYLVEVPPSESMDYQDALILAMKREKAAFRLYSDLANATEETELAAVFRSLAQEEAKHKLRFELEYDEGVQQEN